ncbi:MAG TPA: flavodoxin domain-containing protein [Clostridiales bacterium]|nr:flavodoxin domain-containing protein [Clostridiales bacterium]
MVIVYESKTGFTRRYADMLSAKTGIKAYPTKEISNVDKNEEIIFMGWMMAGKVQGLKKVRNLNIKAVCATGTARCAEPSTEAVIERNRIDNLPFFYLRGGCLPLKQLKGMDKFILSLFVKMLKRRKDKDEETIEAIDHIENGFDGVKEENLQPVLEWLKTES